jgi:hypothetical protein
MVPINRRATCALVAALALPLAAPDTGAAKPRFRLRYGGTTSQTDPFVLELARGAKQVKSVSLLVDGECANGDPIGFWATLRFEVDAPAALPAGLNVVSPRKLRRSGRFRASGPGIELFGDARGVLTHRITGRVRRNGSASGTYGARIRLLDDASGDEITTCDTGTIRWSARSERGRVFTGRDANTVPTVLELDADRTNVATFRFGWAAACEPAGGVLLGDTLSDIPLAGGAFGETFQVPFADTDGNRQTIDYKLDGHLANGRATGTFGVELAQFDPSGAPIASCDTGTVDWSLRST